MIWIVKELTLAMVGRDRLYICPSPDDLRLIPPHGLFLHRPSAVTIYQWLKDSFEGQSGLLAQSSNRPDCFSVKRTVGYDDVWFCQCKVNFEQSQKLGGNWHVDDFGHVTEVSINVHARLMSFRVDSDYEIKEDRDQLVLRNERMVLTVLRPQLRTSFENYRQFWCDGFLLADTTIGSAR